MRKTLLIAALGLGSILGAVTLPVVIAIAQTEGGTPAPGDDGSGGGCDHRKKDPVTS
ncbi:hypothetical protein [Chelativorans sp. J32]|uniref:hypothetical protein n=1 Tax=Chelativorans sp. J32 TaxID=935840 RepID=UPI0004B9B1E3|nr:hypothetical protein [Chelativorans sp. J32]